MRDVRSVPACSMKTVHVPVMVVDWEAVEAVVIVPVREQVVMGSVD